VPVNPASRTITALIRAMISLTALQKEIFVLNRYFIRPTTVDRIRSSCIGEGIERYVVWLTEQHYAARNVSFRVPVLVRLGELPERLGRASWTTCRLM
jgi:hypothetical protein